MFRKILSLVSFFLIVSFLLSACAPAATAVPTQPPAPAQPTAAPVQPSAVPVQPTVAPAQPTTAPVPAAKKVTITWWHINTVDDQKALWQKLANDYMAAHPNVSIEITVLENEAFKTKLTTVMQSGNPPDIFQSWGGGVMNDYATAGLLKDITPDLQKDGWADTFSPGALAVYSYQAKFYGVPRDMGMVGFWYNKDLFTKAGIQTPPATWTDFLADVSKLKAAGVTPIALGEKDKWPGAFWWEYLAVRIGGKDAFDAAYSRKGAFTDQPFIDAGKAMQQLVALKPFQNGFLGSVQNDEAELVADGKASMELMGQWAPGVEVQNSANGKGLGDKLGFFPFPTVTGGKGNAADALGGGNGFAVGKNASPEAVDFLKFLSSADSQSQQAKIGMSVPVVKGSETAIADPLLKIVQQNAAAAPYFQLYYDQYMPAAVGSVINDNVQGLFAGTMTPEQVSKAIDESAAQELK